MSYDEELKSAYKLIDRLRAELDSLKERHGALCAKVYIPEVPLQLSDKEKAWAEKIIKEYEERNKESKK